MKQFDLALAQKGYSLALPYGEIEYDRMKFDRIDSNGNLRMKDSDLLFSQTGLCLNGDLEGCQLYIEDGGWELDQLKKELGWEDDSYENFINVMFGSIYDYQNNVKEWMSLQGNEDVLETYRQFEQDKLDEISLKEFEDDMRRSYY